MDFEFTLADQGPNGIRGDDDVLEVSSGVELHESYTGTFKSSFNDSIDSLSLQEEKKEKEDLYELEKICRICLQSEECVYVENEYDTDDEYSGPLISPCLCKGSSKYVHVRCLQMWRNRNVGKKSYNKCDLCGFKYKYEQRNIFNLLSIIPISFFSYIITTIIIITLCILMGYNAQRSLLLGFKPNDILLIANWQDLILAKIGFKKLSESIRKDIILGIHKNGKRLYDEIKKTEREKVLSSTTSKHNTFTTSRVEYKGFQFDFLTGGPLGVWSIFSLIVDLYSTRSFKWAAITNNNDAIVFIKNPTWRQHLSLGTCLVGFIGYSVSILRIFPLIQDTLGIYIPGLEMIDIYLSTNDESNNIDNNNNINNNKNNNDNNSNKYRTFDTVTDGHEGKKFDIPIEELLRLDDLRVWCSFIGVGIIFIYLNKLVNYLIGLIRSFFIKFDLLRTNVPLNLDDDE